MFWPSPAFSPICDLFGSITVDVIKVIDYGWIKQCTKEEVVGTATIYIQDILGYHSDQLIKQIVLPLEQQESANSSQNKPSEKEKEEEKAKEKAKEPESDKKEASKSLEQEKAEQGRAAREQNNQRNQSCSSVGRGSMVSAQPIAKISLRNISSIKSLIAPYPINYNEGVKLDMKISEFINNVTITLNRFKRLMAFVGLIEFVDVEIIHFKRPRLSYLMLCLICLMILTLDLNNLLTYTLSVFLIMGVYYSPFFN